MLQIELATTNDAIAATFEVMSQLRPHIACEEYVAHVRRLMASDRFQLVAGRDDGAVTVVAGYRYMEMLYCGRLLSIDDLVTDERTRSRGHGKAMLDWLEVEARREGCTEIQLISRVTREHAHRFYFREGFGIDAFHFRRQVPRQSS